MPEPTITITGNLGRDPEFKTTQSGKEFAVFSVAVRQGYGEKQTTGWYNISAWGEYPVARVREQLSEGNYVTVTGRLTIRKYKNSAGYDSISVDLSVFQAGDIVPHKWTKQSTWEGDPNRERKAPVTPTAPVSDDEIPF